MKWEGHRWEGVAVGGERSEVMITVSRGTHSVEQLEGKWGVVFPTHFLPGSDL